LNRSLQSGTRAKAAENRTNSTLINCNHENGPFNDHIKEELGGGGWEGGGRLAYSLMPTEGVKGGGGGEGGDIPGKFSERII
jgi:hypothetical protein